MKNIIIIVADSLRRDTFDCIARIPDSIPYRRFEVTSCNSCTELSLPWMLSGRDWFSPTMSIPTDMKKLGYSTTLIHSNPVVSRFKTPFDNIIDLGRKSPIQRQLKRYSRLTRYIPNSIYSRIRGGIFKKYLPYARIKEKLFTLDTLNQDRPMFVWLHLMDPHTPYYPEMTKLSIQQIIKTNRNHTLAVLDHRTPNLNEAKHWYELYKLESTSMFEALLRWLKKIDFTRNTVIFTSDHGEEFGEHEHYGHKGNRFFPQNVEVPFYIFGDGFGTTSIQSHKNLRNLVKKIRREVKH